MNVRTAQLLISVSLLFQNCYSIEQKYVREAISIMEKNSINRKTINWRRFRSEVMDRASKDKTMTDSHNTIAFALTLLGDNHSILATPDKLKTFYGTKAELPAIDHKLEGDQIAYIKVPAFVGNDSLCSLYAATIQSIVRQFDERAISRWIIDLREDYGGNMWPMFLGLSPLLGEGIHGYFSYPDSTYLEWKCTNGVVFEGSKSLQQISHPYHIKTPVEKIAVLISGETGSSGEAIAICFKGKGNVRFFGQKTYGATTSNNKYKLSDGTEMYLTVGRFCDRDKRAYQGCVIPDELISDREETTLSAINWLGQFR